MQRSRQRGAAQWVETANPPNDCKEQGKRQEGKCGKYKQAALLVMDNCSMHFEVATLLVEQVAIWPIERKIQEAEDGRRSTRDQVMEA